MASASRSSAVASRACDLLAQLRHLRRALPQRVALLLHGVAKRVELAAQLCQRRLELIVSRRPRFELGLRICERRADLDGVSRALFELGVQGRDRVLERVLGQRQALCRTALGPRLPTDGGADRGRLAELLERRHRDHGVAEPQRCLTLLAGLGPGRDLEGGAPVAGLALGLGSLVATGGKAVAASLDVYDQQLLVLGDLGLAGRPSDR